MRKERVAARPWGRLKAWSRSHRRTLQDVGLLLLGLCLGLAMLLVAEPVGMHFYQLRHGEVSLGDVFNGFLLVVAVVAALLAGRQLWDSAATAKATFVKDLYSRMFADADIREAFYLVEYGEFVWDETLRGSEKEKKVDGLLGFANLVCELWARGSIPSADMRLFDYEFSRVHLNDGVRAYLSHLGDWYSRVGMDGRPFSSFIRYCEGRKWRGPGLDKWLSESVHRNLARLVHMASMAAGPDFASEAKQAIQREPRLMARLGTVDTVVVRYPVATLLGELVGKIRCAHADQPLGSVIQAALPFAEWQYGTYALERGLDDVGWGRTGRLLKAHPQLAGDLVEALWSVGLLLIAELGADADNAANDMRAALAEADPRGAIREVTSRTRQCIAGLATDGWGVPSPPAGWDEHRVRLWENAVVMARARFEREGADPAHPDQGEGGEAPFAVFKSLLGHVAEDGKWPLPHRGNDDFVTRNPAVAEKFRDTSPDAQPVGPEPVRGHVEFLWDPLEILNIGNAFGTCLRLARRGDAEETRSVLGWATNANIRVIAVVDADRVVRARQTLGLCTAEPVGVLLGPVYPPDSSEDLRQAIAKFRADFLTATKLRRVSPREQPENEKGVQRTCVRAYNLGWEDAEAEEMT